MSGTSPPTLAGFQWFVTNIMGIDALTLPTNSPVIGYSFQIAMDTVNLALAPLAALYSQAVYNLAGDLLLNFAQDQPGRTFFETARVNYGINKFTPGMVSSTSDSSTATGLLNIEAMKNFTMDDLQRTKTPYGRVYLGIAQAYGPTIWGLS